MGEDATRSKVPEVAGLVTERTHVEILSIVVVTYLVTINRNEYTKYLVAINRIEYLRKIHNYLVAINRIEYDANCCYKLNNNIHYVLPDLRNRIII